MLIFAMQISATSIALEKEEKTLETLLTLPMGRLTILTGKLAGSVALAGISAVAYIIGFGYYVGSAFGSSGISTVSLTDLQALGLVPSSAMYALLGVTIFITVVSALALAVCLAVFADNVRSAQSLVGILFVPIIMPALILMFADISLLPTVLQWILYALPYTHTILAVKAVFLGDVPVILRSIIYISVFTTAVLYLAARIFTTERVITGRLFAKRLRPRG
jgi:ABC-2 type transport system permease protein